MSKYRNKQNNWSAVQRFSLKGNYFLMSILDLDLSYFSLGENLFDTVLALEKSYHADFMHSCKVQTHYLLLTGTN